MPPAAAAEARGRPFSGRRCDRTRFTESSTGGDDWTAGRRARGRQLYDLCDRGSINANLPDNPL
eukprot:7534832-Pyramimonas_sp.AAC.1